ncbi:MAG: L-rhamnose isomerase [Fimbriimonadaceae bacterium]
MSAYELARQAYGELGIDTEESIGAALSVPISIHCWQGDDVGGFEPKDDAAGGGGIMATGHYPGKARNADELRADYDQVLRLVPGPHRANLHAIYAETDGRAVDRDALGPEHFRGWIDWAKDRNVGLDFNPTYFAHPKAADGFTLSHRDPDIRKFWVDHGRVCRTIAGAMGQALGTPCVNNHWIPDGAKDSPANRWSPRRRLIESYDAILEGEIAGCVDAVESKLFGLGSEDYVSGSFEFYSHYALKKGVVFCLDMGHFHPTETIADKLSSLLQFHPKLLLHLSRPMRWDSDHVVLFNDDVRNVFHELVRGDALGRVFVALDFFDASINRIMAWVIGIRSTRKALLYALLEPSPLLQKLEAEGRLGQKLAMMEEMKTMPFGAVWDELCRRADVPVGRAWLDEAERYETSVLSHRN